MARQTLFLLTFFLAGSTLEAATSGDEVYKSRCVGCHDQLSARIPSRGALQKMSATGMVRTLDFGLMMSNAYPVRGEARGAVANLLGSGFDDTAIPGRAEC